jgi:hypothetical protein
MVELHGWVIIGWTIGTAVMAFGSAWGAIRVTQKSVVATLKEIKSDMGNLQIRISETEKNYTTQVGCRELRIDCRAQQTKENSVICHKIDEVKTLLIIMAEKQIETKDLNADRFGDIRDRLTKIEAKSREAGNRNDS